MAGTWGEAWEIGGGCEGSSAPLPWQRSHPQGWGRPSLPCGGDVSRSIRVCWWQVVAQGGGGVERLKEGILFGLQPLWGPLWRISSQEAAKGRSDKCQPRACCCCSVAQLCPTLCDPMDYNTPGLSVPHHLPKFAQVHVLCISDAIQPSYPLMPPSPSALNLSHSNESAVLIK